MAVSSSVFGYIVYRLLHYILEWVHGLVGRFTGWNDVIHRMQTDAAEEMCEVCTPLARRKEGQDADLTRTCDYILWHKEFVSIDSLVDPRWTLYCVGADWVYFVYSERTMRDYQSRKVPFIYDPQYKDAELVARVSIGQFCRFGNSLGPLKPKVVYMSNMPRAGTTLLTSLLQASDKLIALSEPGIFGILALLKETNQFDQATLHGIVKATFCKTCHEFTSDDVVIIKPQSNGGILVEEIYATLGHGVQHMFLYRRNVDAAMKSIEKMLSIEGMVNTVITISNLSESLCDGLIGFSRYQPKQFAQIRPQTLHDYTYLLYVGPLVWLMDQLKLGIPIFTVQFEEIVKNPEETMKNIFQYLGVMTLDNQEGLLQKSLEAMTVDSQTGTNLAKEQMAKAPFTTMTPAIRAKFDDMNATLGLPAMFKEGWAPDFDDHHMTSGY